MNSAQFTIDILAKLSGGDTAVAQPQPLDAKALFDALKSGKYFMLPDGATVHYIKPLHTSPELRFRASSYLRLGTDPKSRRDAWSRFPRIVAISPPERLRLWIPST